MSRRERAKAFFGHVVAQARARVVERLRALPRDDDGGSMVFGAMTLFTLVLFTMLVYQVGMASGDRIQLQNAADAGAYAGALVEADAVEAIAFANEGMGYVYYNSLRYAVDAIVYGTLHEFQLHHQDVMASDHSPAALMSTDPRVLDRSLPSNPAAPDDILVGTPGGLFQERFQAATQHASLLITQAKWWLADLHDAERLILASTPRLVATTAARIAGQNGAVAVAVSSDLDDAFRVATTRTDARSGFDDDFDGTQNAVHQQLFRRYERRRLAVDRQGGVEVARDIPHQWFDPATGEPTGDRAYYQIRLCWNRQDWNHDLNPANNIHALGPYQPYTRGPPNGHWHLQHQHTAITNSTPPVTVIVGPHTMGHDPDGGAYEHQVDASSKDADLLPQELVDLVHHAAQRCPTCNAKYGRRFSGYTQIEKTLQDAERRYGGAVDTRVRFRDDAGEPRPRPLRARAALFRAGVTVAAWIPGSGVGSIFARSPFGMLAVASAQIGIRRRDGTVSVARDVQGQTVFFEQMRLDDGTALDHIDLEHDQAFRNLNYASEGARGMKIGARLVPVSRQLTWVAGTPGTGLRSMLVGARRNWYNPDGTPRDGPPSELATMNLRLDVERSPDAFVH